MSKGRPIRDATLSEASPGAYDKRGLNWSDLGATGSLVRLGLSHSPLSYIHRPQTGLFFAKVSVVSRKGRKIGFFCMANEKKSPSAGPRRAAATFHLVLIVRLGKADAGLPGLP